MILVTGAAGKTGRAVVRALLRRGVVVRAFVRTAEQVETLRALGAVDCVAGDLRDAAALVGAARGAAAVYHICPNVSPDELAIGANALAAAQAAGARVVYHSVLHPQTQAMPHHWKKLAVEDAVLASGLEYSILQPASYMQNLLPAWRDIVDRGVYAVPYALETRLSLVDLEDVAEAAAVALTEPGHARATYELSGAEILTPAEIAGVLGLELGRAVRAEVLPAKAWAARAAAAGLGEYQIDALTKMFQYYEQYGFCGNSNVLSWLLRRPPATFEGFVRRLVRQDAA